MRGCASLGAKTGPAAGRIPCTREGTHMGEKRPVGTNAISPRNSKDLILPLRRVAAFPCAQSPLGAHGSTTTNRDTLQKTPQFHGKSAPVPRRRRSPMCSSLLSPRRPGQGRPHRRTPDRRLRLDRTARSTDSMTRPPSDPPDCWSPHRPTCHPGEARPSMSPTGNTFVTGTISLKRKPSEPAPE